jgi:O-antigen/teichoic acid export membrane protein
MLVWADLGLGNGLMTQLSRSLGTDDQPRAQREISTTYFLVSIVGVMMLLAIFISLHFLSWTSILGLSDSMGQQARTLAMVSLGMFACNVPISLIQRVQYAAEQVSRSNLITALGPWTSLLFAATAAIVGAPLWVLVLAAASGPPLANIFASATFFRANPHLRPAWRTIRRDQAAPLLRLGGAFLVITTMAAVAYNLDNLVIAQVSGASVVTDFGVSARLLAALGLLVTVVNQPLWPMHARAIAAHDYPWVRRNTARMVKVSSAAVLLASVVVIALAQVLLDVLTKGGQTANYPLLLALASWWLIVSATSPLSMVQNAAGNLRPQLLGWSAFLLLSVPGKVFAARDLGIQWVPLVGTGVYLLTVLPALLAGYRSSVTPRPSSE